MAESLLLVEDDPTLAAALKQRLVLEGFAVRHAPSLADARAQIEKSVPTLVLSDIRLPDGSGETLLDILSERLGSVPIIFMTAYGDVEQAVRLVRQGARDYLIKPFDLDACIAQLKSLLPSDDEPSSEPFATLGLSPQMASIRKTLEKVADIDLPVLILGETGTGKELAARFLHNARKEDGLDFQAINCGQLSPELADSTLFGHEKGAFTGAHQRQLGAFESVQKGTLLLDEIGEIDPQIQVKLLRLLQEREFSRVGSQKAQTFEGRVLCATNRDLEAAVAAGTFREDLWYRINVITVQIPPLRERLEEVEPLITRFAQDAAKRFLVPQPAVSQAVLDAAQAYDWPGNIRELRNRTERAVALSDAAVLTVDDLFPDQQTLQTVPMPAKNLADVREAAEKAHIEQTLKDVSGNMSAASKALGVSRTTLWEKIRRYEIDATGE